MLPIQVFEELTTGSHVFFKINEYYNMCLFSGPKVKKNVVFLQIDVHVEVLITNDY